MPERKIDYKEVREKFASFIKTIGGRVANSPMDHGAYQLDRDGGGWAIERICLGSSGVTRMFGAGRMTSSQIISHMRFAIDAISAAMDHFNDRPLP